MNQYSVKNRPAELKYIRGQDEVVKSIIKLVQSNNFPSHSLFTGSTGVGKSSMAILLADLLNCEHYDYSTLKKCLKCEYCNKIKTNYSISRISCSDLCDFKGKNFKKQLVHRLSMKAFFSSRIMVNIFEEVDQLSKKQQKSLLLILEKSNQCNEIVSVFTTICPRELIEEFRNRLVEFHFNPIEPKYMKKVVKDTLRNNNKTIEESALKKLIGSNYGDARYIVNRIPLYLEAP